MRVPRSLVNVTILGVALAICLSSWLALLWIEAGLKNQLQSWLNTTLKNAHESVLDHHKEKSRAAAAWSKNTQIREEVEKLLKLPHTPTALIASSSQDTLRAWLKDRFLTGEYRGYFIIGPGNINLASTRDANVGAINLLSSQKSFLDKVWSGQTLVSLPLRSDVPLKNQLGKVVKGLATMFVASPVRNDRGQIVAILALRIEPHESFSTILKRSQFGASGETYAFDKSGNLISESRFNNLLKEIGLLTGSSSILNVAIRDPMANLVTGERATIPRKHQPLTLMAESGTAGKSGWNLDGYRDYRGVPVVGVWLWDSELGLGIATEVDVDEAFVRLQRAQIVILSFTAIPLGSLGILWLVFYWSRREINNKQEALVDARKRAEEANKTKSEFLANMSHDLRTPLNAIIGFSELILKQYFGPVGDKYQEYAKDIHSSGKLLLSLVNDILDLSAIESGKQSLAKVPVSVRDIVAECEKVVEARALSHGIELLTEIPEDLPSIYANRRAVMQILINLLSNAVKFTQTGGQVIVRATATDEYHTIEVIDTGHGIPADRIETITKPFVSGKSDPHNTQESTGLGLSIVEKLVELHEGNLDIKSVVGEGTTVTVQLPNCLPQPDT